jgi:MFS family permease
VGGGLTVAGALLRYIAALNDGHNSHATTYFLMLLGQSLGALAQPIFLGYPAALASIWFSVEERDIATTIGAMFSPIGNAVGQLVPVMIVDQSGDDDGGTIHGMTDLMLVELIICIVPLILCFLLFKDAPLTPPSMSTKLKIDAENKTRHSPPPQHHRTKEIRTQT